MANKQTVMISVPEGWFIELLKIATDFEKMQSEHVYGNRINDRIFNKSAELVGYALSTRQILEYNERHLI